MLKVKDQNGPQSPKSLHTCKEYALPLIVPTYLKVRSWPPGGGADVGSLPTQRSYNLKRQSVIPDEDKGLKW